MAQHSKEVIKEFETLCMWVHQSWQTRKCLFDNASNLAAFQQPHYEHFFFRLHRITQEHWMQEVAKLHDPAGKPGHYNLSVNYIVECGDWDRDIKARLIGLHEKMLPFAMKMKPPRNKLTAHNDVSTILAATELGKFDSGEDIEYFANLKAFVEIIVNTVLGEHFDYDNAVPADVDLFADAFNRGRIGAEANHSRGEDDERR
jgi:hypothetical protein